MNDDLTRPIIGIENRTAQEVFDIMCDRINHRLRSLTGKPRVGVTDEMVEDAYRAGNKEYARIYGTAPFGETSDNDRSIMRAALEAALKALEKVGG